VTFVAASHGLGIFGFLALLRVVSHTA